MSNRKKPGSGKGKVIEGVVVPVITPLESSGRPSGTGIRRMMNHLIESGVRHIFVLGSLGEGPSFAVEDKEHILETAAAAIAGRANLLVGLGGTSLQENLNFMRRSGKYGPAAFVATLPSYYYLGDREIVDYYACLAKETGTQLFAYNIPFFTKSVITPQTAVTLFEKGIIAGLKDSSDDWESLQQIIFYSRQNRRARIYAGDERFYLSAGLLGVSGFVSAGANILPETVVQIERFCREGKVGPALDLYQFFLSIRRLYNRPPSVIANIKALAELKGFCSRRMVKPMLSLSGREYRQLKKDYQFLSAEKQRQ